MSDEIDPDTLRHLAGELRDMSLVGMSRTLEAAADRIEVLERRVDSLKGDVAMYGDDFGDIFNLIDDWGTTDGAHHKQWVLDHRVVAGTRRPVVVAVNLPIIDIPDPNAQSIVWGPCRLLNRDDRPDKDLVGRWVAVRCCGRDENEWARAMAGIGEWEDYSIPPRELSPSEEYHGDFYHEPEPMAARHHPGCVIGVVRVVGWWDEAVRGGLDGEQFAQIDPHSSWSHGGQLRPSGNRPHEGPWWSDATDCAWLLDTPKPIEPVACEGDVIELSEEVLS